MSVNKNTDLTYNMQHAANSDYIQNAYRIMNSIAQEVKGVIMYNGNDTANSAQNNMYDRTEQAIYIDVM